MERAILLATRGAGSVSPNPMVGAVLAVKHRLLAEGAHERFGGPHAERRVLAAAPGRIPADAVLYLTLEPCTYAGKTPACVELLLSSPIRRFVIATTDPNPRVRGRGVRMLRAAGREVRLGLCGAEADRLIRPFLLSQRAGRARITLKLASTLDGRLADHWGTARWITGSASRRLVGRLRGLADAVLVGRGTVCADDPRLRSLGAPRRPVSRIVVSASLGFDPDCRLARIGRLEAGRRGGGAVLQRVGNWVAEAGTAGRVRWVRSPRLIVATTDPPSRRLRAFERSGWEVWRIPSAEGAVDLGGLARRAGQEGLIDLFVEPGPTLAGSFLREGPVDRLLLFMAPVILGGGRDWSGSMPPLRLSRSLRLSSLSGPSGLGDDILLEMTGPRGGAIVPPRDARNALHSS